MDAKRVLVIGLGRFGSALARTLYEQNAEVTVVDVDADRVADLASQSSMSFVCDATEDGALLGVGARDVDVAVVTFGEHFEAAVLCVAALKECGVREIVARAVSPSRARILRSVGASFVVEPDREAGERLGQALLASKTPAT